MHERVDKYWSTGAARESNFIETHFLEGPDEYVFSVDVDVNRDPDPSTSDNHRALEDFRAQADSIQAQIDELRGAQVLAIEKGKRKYEFGGVEILKRNIPPPSSSSVPPPPPPSGPNVYARGPQQSVPDQRQAPNQPPAVSGKPGSRPRDPSPQRPQGPMCPVAILPKPPAQESQFRYQSAIKSGVKTSNLLR